MGRGRLFIAVLVALCLTVPPIAGEAQAAETSLQCGFSSEVKADGFDGTRAVASYVVRATWCIETTYETRTITEDVPSDELSSGSDEAKVDKAKKKKAKGRKAKKRARRRSKRSDGGGSGSTPRTRTERRVVSTCVTDFQLDAEPRTLVDGAHLIGATTTPTTTGDACSSRSYRVVGRFGRDYIAGVPGFARSVISEGIDGLTLENYPLGRFGTFDIDVHFTKDGARCDRCLPSFEFCDVRVVGDTSSTCVNL
jgi:hypothetical protein